MGFAARWGAVTVALLAVSTPAASASSVSVAPLSEWGDHRLRYEAGFGERNDVTLEFLPGQGIHHRGVRITDAGAVIEAGESCRSIEPHVVECGLPDDARAGVRNHFFNHLVNLYDLDDTIGFGPRDAEDYYGSVSVFGGAGADTLHAVPGGGIRGGSGDDHLIAEGDFAAYLSGDAGADRLTGGEGGDTLSGGTGPDRLSGGGGDDRLFGEEEYARLGSYYGDAQDFLDGGDGEDFLVGGPAIDAVVCGTGSDVSIVELARDLVPLGCERAAFMVDTEFGIWFSVSPRPFAWRPSAALFRVRCAELNIPFGYERAVPCRGSIVLREASGRRRLLGRGALPGQVAKVWLTPLGMQLARSPAGTLATVTLRGHAIGPPNGWTFRLKRP